MDKSGPGGGLRAVEKRMQAHLDAAGPAMVEHVMTHVKFDRLPHYPKQAVNHSHQQVVVVSLRTKDKAGCTLTHSCSQGVAACYLCCICMKRDQPSNRS